MTNKKLKSSLPCFLATPKIHNLKIVNRISESRVINLTRVGREGPLGCKISNSLFDTGPCPKGLLGLLHLIQISKKNIIPRKNYLLSAKNENFIAI